MIIAEWLSRQGHRPLGVVHVGAHLAQEMEEYLLLGARLVVWVEADHDRCEAVKQKIEIAGRSDVRQLAIEALVADRDDLPRAFFEFTNEGASSSMFQSTDVLRNTFPGVVETGDVKMIKTARLDTLLGRAGVTPSMVDVLIFDIQGAELMALKGSGAFLDTARFVEVELSTEPIYEGAPLAPEVDRYLTDHGFVRQSDIPWHGDTIYSRP